MNGVVATMSKCVALQNFWMWMSTETHGTFGSQSSRARCRSMCEDRVREEVRFHLVAVGMCLEAKLRPWPQVPNHHWWELLERREPLSRQQAVVLTWQDDGGKGGMEGGTGNRPEASDHMPCTCNRARIPEAESYSIHCLPQRSILYCHRDIVSPVNHHAVAKTLNNG